ncbi:MAG: MBL fold metallo-hydrolase [Deltaproteobacteria bacterium]|jgi:glyoxylase-like metal-dependent hydrolase (beta-lactamase superfamily II)|nr:MBL fold metallo-hydrolase [Deltaproteobacteria bacterium]
MLQWEDIYYYEKMPNLDFSGEINSNSILIKGPKHILIDPGTAKGWGELKEAIVADGLDPMDIGVVFCTHSHPDHAEAAVMVAKQVKADLLMSLAELDFFVMGGARFYYLNSDGTFLSMQGNMPVYDVPDTRLFIKGFPGPFIYEGRQFKLYLTPGHTPGGMCFHWPERGFLAVGDVYFKGTIGSIALYGSQPSQMYKSVTLLNGLLDVEKVICGHGPIIEGREKVVKNYEILFAEIADKKAKGIV